jgi:hypothetical protein
MPQPGESAAQRRDAPKSAAQKCPRQDSNLYAVSGTGPSNQPVYQFQHVGPCSGRDSNPHGVNPHRVLNPARLPIPPPERINNHGAEGSRTPDLLNAIQALSQLSYGPNHEHDPSFQSAVTGLTGLEPATSGVTDRHSNQLSYSPNCNAPRGNRTPLSTLKEWCPSR